LLLAKLNRNKSALFKWNVLNLLVRLTACISAAAIGWISMIFDIGDFYKNRLETPYLVKVGQFARRPKYVSLLPATLNHH
jgi:hypothetical protein